jgi:hypothetical protein
MNRTLRPSRIFNLGWIIFTIGWFISLGVFGPDKQSGRISIYLSSAFWVSQSICGLFGLMTSLELDQEGFTVRTMFRRRRYRWSEVKVFLVVRSGLSSGGVVFNLSNAADHKPHHGSFWRFTSDHDAVLPSGFGLSGEKLADTMNQWRWRWILTAESTARAVNAN